jgi:hypothetical protein
LRLRSSNNCWGGCEPDGELEIALPGPGSDRGARNAIRSAIAVSGIIRFADRSTDDPVVRRIADLAYDGIAVTDPSGHVAYSNSAYLVLQARRLARGAGDQARLDRARLARRHAGPAMHRQRPPPRPSTLPRPCTTVPSNRPAAFAQTPSGFWSTPRAGKDRPHRCDLRPALTIRRDGRLFPTAVDPVPRTIQRPATSTPRP